jgi:2-dehydropantoate 2-reductase
MTTANNGPRYIIYGAGAIGGVIGGHLALVNKPVIFIGRPYHMDAIKKNGFRFTTPYGLNTLKIETATSPGQIKFTDDDVILLTVKGQNTEGAMKDLKAVVKDIPVFCCQNGVRNEETVMKYFPRVYGVMVRIGAVYVENGEVTARRDPPGWLVMGRYPTGADAVVEKAAAGLREAGFHVKVSPDVMPYKYGKLLLNLANAIGAITNTTEEESRKVTMAVQKEATDILSAAGIHVATAKQLAEEWPAANEHPRAIIDTEAQSSTWQSLARKQGSVETDYLNGEIVRVAQSIGKSAPMNEMLMKITQEMAVNFETPGKYSMKELAVMLGIK